MFPNLVSITALVSDIFLISLGVNVLSFISAMAEVTNHRDKTNTNGFLNNFIKPSPKVSFIFAHFLQKRKEKMIAGFTFAQKYPILKPDKIPTN